MALNPMALKECKAVHVPKLCVPAEMPPGTEEENQGFGSVYYKRMVGWEKLHLTVKALSAGEALYIFGIHGSDMLPL